MKQDFGRQLHQLAEENASENPHEGYVLITCSKASKSSQRNVRMTYQGDPGLISFLLENGLEKVLQDASIEEA